MAWNLDNYEDVASLNRWYQDNFPTGRIDLKTEYFNAENQEILVRCDLYRDYKDEQPAVSNLARGKAADYPKNMARWYVEDTATSVIGRCILLLKAAEKTATQDSMKQVAYSEEQLKRKEHFAQGGTIESYKKGDPGHKVEHPFKPADAVKELPNEPETFVWDTEQTTAFQNEQEVFNNLERELGATLEGFECSHGQMQRREGTSKTGRPFLGYTCPSRSKQDQCEPRWAKFVGGKWVFENKATDYGR